MFNFGINWEKVIRENLHRTLHTPIRLNRIRAMVKPFKVIYADFLAVKNELFYTISYDGGTASLETALNDRFDKVARGITISTAFYNKVYIYAKSELKPAIKLYLKWNNSTSFDTGKFCFYQGKIYMANTTALNKVPGVDPEWTLQPSKQAPVLRSVINYNGSLAFYVNVPVSVTFSDAEMRSFIDSFILAGPGYEIRIV